MKTDIQNKIHIKDENAMDEFARKLANLAQNGDIITLSGDLGVGKTYFSRQFIRCFLKQQDLIVPSPTFTLMQYYDVNHDHNHQQIIHCDFYRLHNADELVDIGFDELVGNRLLLIEWPNIAYEFIKADDHHLHIDLEFYLNFATQRQVCLTANHRTWQKRLEHL